VLGDARGDGGDYILLRAGQIKNADVYVENGIHLMLGFSGPDYDLAPLEGLIAWRDSRNWG
jgi:hypothetical protein